jgi:hypothetical protein
MTIERDPQPGDWVTVTGQLVSRNDSPHHPDDLPVRLESRNEDYVAHIRRDRTVPCAAPSWAYPCTSLHEFKPGLLLHCALEHDHSGLHSRDGTHWVDRASYGYVELA